MPDSWYWLFDDTGNFIVKSRYRQLAGEWACPDMKFWNKIWHLKLPTSSYQEREVWAAVGMMKLVLVVPGDTVFQVTKRVFQNGNKDQGAMFGMICWALWYRRNKWLWDKIVVSAFGIKSMALNMKSDWNKVRELEAKEGMQTQRRDSTWCKPPAQWVKINTDAPCDINGGWTGLGCVARDDNGHFIRARSKRLQTGHQPRIAEAISLKEALSWTKQWRSRKCIFETDAKSLVDAITGSKDNQGRSTFDTIVDDCKELLKHFEEVSLVFVPRSANSVAHLLARGAHFVSGLQEWNTTAPDFIICNLALEAI
ncbi:uncharacterized protein LOC141719767 [Apium graveolens]|uniref:uncharacterized protein LOC141719767 n=1 Tax=Apium graveolens TaxID=4045 RepID=UPI003D7A3E47